MSEKTNNKIPNVPNLRFMEFVDEWKEMSLKKCCISLEYGLGVEATEFDGINKYIRITDIDEQTNKYINLPSLSRLQL